MDASLRHELLHRDVEYYARMRERGESNARIADFLHTQLTELTTSCARYIELEAWAMRELGVPEGGDSWNNWIHYQAVESDLVNEVGSKIHFSVQALPPGDGVRVLCVSPTSTVDHTWTVQEGRELAALLRAVVGHGSE
jgi:hypothetical protein